MQINNSLGVHNFGVSPQEDAAPHQEETGILWTLYQLL